MPSPSALGIASLVKSVAPTRGRAITPSSRRQILFFCQAINAKTLEIVSFHLCHTYLGLGELHHLPKRFGMLSGFD